jgi:hypothetical protein
MLAFFALGIGNAQAEPKSGVGVDAGLVSSHMSATPGNYQSSGLSLGLDYQFAVSPSVSINPFLMSSGESISGAVPSGTKASHGLLGLQFRYWIEDVFLGAHLAAYSETLSNTSGNITTSTTANGGGAGLVVGWEQPKGGLFLVGQVDSAKLHYNGYDSKLSDFRVSLGYRWK